MGKPIKSALYENTKPHKANYGSLPSKGVYEAHEIGPQHGYLGDSRNSIEKGYVPSGRAGNETEGTSVTLHADHFVKQKTGRFHEQSGRGNKHKDSSDRYPNSTFYNETGMPVKRGTDEKY